MARCKYGKLKNPSGRRRCKQKPRRGGKRRAKGARRASKRQCKAISVNCHSTMGGTQICKVHVSGEPVKVMSKAKTASYVGTIVRALRKRGCHPRVKRA